MLPKLNSNNTFTEKQHVLFVLRKTKFIYLLRYLSFFYTLCFSFIVEFRRTVYINLVQYVFLLLSIFKELQILTLWILLNIYIFHNPTADSGKKFPILSVITRDHENKIEAKVLWKARICQCFLNGILISHLNKIKLCIATHSVDTAPNSIIIGDIIRDIDDLISISVSILVLHSCI